MDLVEVGSRTMQVRCIYVGYWKHETHNSQKKRRKNRSAVHGMCMALRTFKLALANDIPFYSKGDALEYVSVSSGAKRALSLDTLTPGASILREKGMSRIAGSSS
jgi:hypothetical protein